MDKYRKPLGERECLEMLDPIIANRLSSLPEFSESGWIVFVFHPVRSKESKTPVLYLLITLDI